MIPPAARATGGSSPHARGAPLHEGGECLHRGLIPACAGSTSSREIAVMGLPAHPRMRGEHYVKGGGGALLSGSSPHARGARGGRFHRPAQTRLIPACAGSTKVSWSLVEAVTGSSPHARGAHGIPEELRVRVRLIPACAGSTGRTAPTPPDSRAHPRMRGEHGAPRWRQGRRTRLIPACAGSTLAAMRSDKGFRAHPRMRGEHFTAAVSAVACSGSSPHARGARRPPGPAGVTPGLTPACAGSTNSMDPFFVSTRAHPRTRGEHRVQCLLLSLPSGSSPHARGAHRVH